MQATFGSKIIPCASPHQVPVLLTIRLSPNLEPWRLRTKTYEGLVACGCGVFCYLSPNQETQRSEKANIAPQRMILRGILRREYPVLVPLQIYGGSNGFRTLDSNFPSRAWILRRMKVRYTLGERTSDCLRLQTPSWRELTILIAIRTPKATLDVTTLRF